MEQPPNQIEPVDDDFRIERDWDPSKGYWEEACVKETFYVAINADDSSKDKIYYLPTEFPKLLIDKEKYYEFSTAMFYTDKSISWEISDVRVENQLKTTTTTSVPLQMSNVGIRMFDGEGDMTISDRIYPLNNVTDLVTIQNLKNKSRVKLPGTLPTIDLVENSYLYKEGDDNKMAQAQVSTRDPRFKEKNNVAEQTLFANTWINDVGLRKEIRHLIMPPIASVELKTCLFDGFDGETFFIDTKKPEDPTPLTNKFISQKWNILNVTPADYRDGWITAAHSGFKDICRQSFYQNGSEKLTSPVCKDAYYKKSEKFLEGNIQSVYRGIPCTNPHGFENTYDLQFLPQDISNCDAHVLKDIQDYKIVDGSYPATIALNYEYNYLPNVSKFQGNKNLKPLMFCVDPSYNGTDIMPTTIRMKIHYSHCFQVYKKNPIFENPKLIPNTQTLTIQQVNFGYDITYSGATMADPFNNSTDTKYVRVFNSMLKLFVPNYPTMYLTKAKTEEEPPKKKLKL